MICKLAENAESSTEAGCSAGSALCAGSASGAEGEDAGQQLPVGACLAALGPGTDAAVTGGQVRIARSGSPGPDRQVGLEAGESKTFRRAWVRMLLPALPEPFLAVRKY